MVEHHFIKHQMNSNIIFRTLNKLEPVHQFIYGWLNSNTQFLATNERTFKVSKFRRVVKFFRTFFGGGLIFLHSNGEYHLEFFTKIEKKHDWKLQCFHNTFQTSICPWWSVDVAKFECLNTYLTFMHYSSLIKPYLFHLAQSSPI